MNCVLCDLKSEESIKFQQKLFYKCTGCQSIFLSPRFYISEEEEGERYSYHQNDVTNEGYQHFVSPITNRIQLDFKNTARGLDFGCGRGPVATYQLRKKGYKINLYDPFFEDHPEVLNEDYDFIICCEVMEHFHEPKKEFQQLYDLLKPGGRLYCKTSLLPKNINFEDWYYKNDPTHVFFYSEETLKWIKLQVGFGELEVFKDLIVFKK
ncbi:MAG: class I SAM-dependent methyltransferase [Gillisia sp.]